jgi:hypothetical protein
MRDGGLNSTEKRDGGRRNTAWGHKSMKPGHRAWSRRRSGVFDEMRDLASPMALIELSCQVCQRLLAMKRLMGLNSYSLNEMFIVKRC